MRQLSTILRQALLAALLVGCFHAPATAQGDADFKYLEVKVLDPDGKPLAEVAVEVAMDGIDFPLLTDEEGIVSFNVPDVIERGLTLSVRQDGYAAVGARWNQGDKVPDELTIQLEKGVAIGGIVHDEEGNPVEGVEIDVTMALGNIKPGELRPWFSGTIGTTDAAGRWRTETAPEEEIQLYFRVNHPDYLQNQNYGQHQATWKQLKSLDHVFVIEKGIEIRGRVVDANDQPVVGATVSSGLDRDNNNEDAVETDEKGEYRLKNVKAGRTNIVVIAKGLSPEVRMISASKETEPVDFQLQPGHHIRIHITDPDGQPLAGVRVSREEWRGNHVLVQNDNSQQTDADGVWEWDGAPADEIQYNFYLRDYMSGRDKRFVPREEVYEIEMGWPLVLSGKVVDAETGKPIEHFEIMEGLRWRGQQKVTWQTQRLEKGEAGKYQVKYTTDCEGYRIKIRAAGYRPVASELIAVDAGEVTLDFELEAGSGPSGVVKTPAGEPAAGAEVAMAIANQYMQVNNGKFQDHMQTPKATADAEGRFQLPFPDDNYLVVLLHESGWQQLTANQLEESGEVTLEPWAKIEGKLMRGKEPLVGEQISAQSQQTRYRQGEPRVNWSNQALTEGDGSFVFERLRAGDTTVSRFVSYGDVGNGARMGTTSHSEHVQLEPGKTAQVQIGGIGNMLKGKFVVPDDYQGEVVWAMGVVRFNEQNQNSRARNPLQALGRAIAQLGQKQAPAAQPTKQKFPHYYATTIAEDGSFEIFDVVPGQYLMNVEIIAPPVGGNYQWNPTASFKKAVTVPEVGADSAGKEVDLGEHELTMTKPAAQATPAGGTLSPAPK